jgi:hypothetical protein
MILFLFPCLLIDISQNNSPLFRFDRTAAVHLYLPLSILPILPILALSFCRFSSVYVCIASFHVVCLSIGLICLRFVCIFVSLSIFYCIIVHFDQLHLPVYLLSICLPVHHQVCLLCFCSLQSFWLFCLTALVLVLVSAFAFFYHLMPFVFHLSSLSKQMHSNQRDDNQRGAEGCMHLLHISCLAGVSFFLFSTEKEFSWDRLLFARSCRWSWDGLTPHRASRPTHN